MGRRLMLTGGLGGALAAALALAYAAPAAGWSRAPGDALSGTQVTVASDADSLCRWSQPAYVGEPSSLTPAPDNELVYYDGTRVDLRLQGSGLVIGLGSVAVESGGGWSGSLTVPPSVPSGTYDLFARCVVDHPDLDGVRTFDFDPQPFSVHEAPPPTVVTVPTELAPPAVAVQPVAEVAGTQTARTLPVTGARQAPAATLPNTGDGTLAVALAGSSSLAIGGLALWWGGRKRPTAQPHR